LGGTQQLAVAADPRRASGIICGVLAYFLLPCRPAEVTFLTQDEKNWVTGELGSEDQTKIGAHAISALRALIHPRVWHLAVTLFAFDIGLYAMSFYMPQSVKSLSSGYSNTVVGLLVMIPHLAGLAAMILVSRSSDRRLERRSHAAIPLVVAGVALMLLGATRSPLLVITLWSFVAMGIYSFFGPFFSIPSRFLAGFSAASGIALINSIGNLGGFVGPSVIGAIAQGARGIYAGLALTGIVGIGDAGSAATRSEHPPIAHLDACSHKNCLGVTVSVATLNFQFGWFFQYEGQQ
jgi:ACS family tartrate transporter-like MFS transporter